MSIYYQTDRFGLYEGDCRVELRGLSDCSVDSVVCDPPYELGFMGKGWDRSGIAYDVNVWMECLRVLKPGGHLLAFGGSRTYHRLACAIEDAGFEIRDQIQWLYATGFPKSLDVSKAIDADEGAEREIVGERKHSANQNIETFTNNGNYKITHPVTTNAQKWNGWGTALKPAHEPIVLARKPLIGTVAGNFLQHGTGGLNIDGCRIETNGEDLGDPSRFLSSDSKLHEGWQRPHKSNGDLMAARADERFGRTEEKGRWPANVIHDGSDEVTALFPESDGQQGDLKGHSKDRLSKGIFGDMKAARDAVARLDSGSAARFFYCAKASQEDRNEGLENLPMRSAGEVTDRKDGSAGLNSPRAGAGRHSGSRNPHPTVKPVDLMRYLCRLVTPPDGIVLDCFCGSGSTGKAAMLEGLRFIGIELNEEYCQLAQLRIEAVTRQGLLFTAAD